MKSKIVIDESYSVKLTGMDSTDIYLLAKALLNLEIKEHYSYDIKHHTSILVDFGKKLAITTGREDLLKNG